MDIMKEEAVTSSFDNSKCPQYKDKNMIILNSKKSNTYFEENLKKYSDMGILPYCKCPKCNSDNLIKHGKYARTVVYIKNSLLVSSSINIQRVKCKDCGKTHALIPSFIIPYKVFTQVYHFINGKMFSSIEITCFFIRFNLAYLPYL